MYDGTERDSGAASGPRELIPRSTVEEIVACRDKALELYAEAFTAIAAADQAMKAAHLMAARAAGEYEGVDTRHFISGSEREIQAFAEAVQLPEKGQFERVARRLTDLRVWSHIVQRTELEKLMAPRPRRNSGSRCATSPTGSIPTAGS